MSTAVRAQLVRHCCDFSKASGTETVQRARWLLYVVLSGSSVDGWPEFEWPVSRRHTIPTPDERVQALASLGYRLAPGAQWDWVEDETPDYHDHPQAVSLLGCVDVVPLPDGE